MADEFLTVNEVAALLKRHSSTIYRRLESGEWDDFAWKDGKDWRIEQGPLLNHLRTNPIHTRRPVEDPMPKPRRGGSRAPELLNVEEAADLIGCSPTTVYRKLDDKEWDAFAFYMGGWLIEREPLLQHMEAHPLYSKREYDRPIPEPKKRRGEWRDRKAKARFREQLREARAAAERQTKTG